ncbi:MAG: hypothetical protein M1828_006238 [Chrysothrix sp. TS-e1954]|nr:MAG: hypothetical protein M1828_006238 [Chrysothrix sp. TS-e1954]
MATFSLSKPCALPRLVRWNHTRKELLLKKGDDSNMTIVCGETEIPTHRFVLCPQSKTVEASCGDAPLEKPRVEVKTDDVPALELVLQMAYDGPFEYNPELFAVIEEDLTGTDIVSLPTQKIERSLNLDLLVYLRALRMAEELQLTQVYNDLAWGLQQTCLICIGHIERHSSVKVWRVKGFIDVLKLLYSDEFPTKIRKTAWKDISEVVDVRHRALIKDEVFMVQATYMPEFMGDFLRVLMNLNENNNRLLRTEIAKQHQQGKALVEEVPQAA